MPSCKGSFQPRDQTWVSFVSCIGRRVLYHWCHLGMFFCYKSKRWTKIMRNFLRGKRPPERGTLVAFLLSGVNEIKMPGSHSQHGRAFPQDLRIPFQTLSLTHSSPHRCPDLNYKALGQAEGSSRVTFILCLNNNGWPREAAEDPVAPTHLLQVCEAFALIQDSGDVPGSNIGDLVVV